MRRTAGSIHKTRWSSSASHSTPAGRTPTSTGWWRAPPKGNGSPQSPPQALLIRLAVSATTVEEHPRTVYFAALRNGEADNFFGPVVTGDPLSEVLKLTNLDPAGGGALEIRLQGATDQSHSVRIELNGVDLGQQAAVHRSGQFSLQLPLTPGQLREGDNVIRLTALGGEEDVTLVDTLRLTYAHRFVADVAAQFLSLPGGKTYTLSGFGNSTIRVIDIGTPEQVREVTATTAPQGSGYAAHLCRPGYGRPRCCSLPIRSLAPAFVRADQSSSWNQPAAAPMSSWLHRPHCCPRWRR